MIESSIENLFTEINNSNEYKEYINIVNILKENKEVNNLIEEIKSIIATQRTLDILIDGVTENFVVIPMDEMLEVYKEQENLFDYEKNKEYIEIDKQIEEKTKVLNSNKEYQEYLSKLKAFNNTLLASSSLLDEYIEKKVSI